MYYCCNQQVKQSKYYYQTEKFDLSFDEHICLYLVTPIDKRNKINAVKTCQNLMHRLTMKRKSRPGLSERPVEFEFLIVGLYWSFNYFRFLSKIIRQMLFHIFSCDANRFISTGFILKYTHGCAFSIAGINPIIPYKTFCLF